MMTPPPLPSAPVISPPPKAPTLPMSLLQGITCSYKRLVSVLSKIGTLLMMLPLLMSPPLLRLPCTIPEAPVWRMPNLCLIAKLPNQRLKYQLPRLTRRTRTKTETSDSVRRNSKHGSRGFSRRTQSCWGRRRVRSRPWSLPTPCQQRTMVA